MSEEQVQDPAPVAAAPKKPRDYQVEALKAMADAFVNKSDTKRGLVVLPTGSGKTFVAARFNKAVVGKLGCHVVWVAHRDALIDQAAEEHALVCPDVKISKWGPDVKDVSGQVILVMIESSKGLAAALEAHYGANSQKLVLAIDEAHHFAEREVKDSGKVYKNMYSDLEGSLTASNLLRFSYGLTATAERLDGKKLGYDRIIFQMPFIEGVQKGALARPRYFEMRTRQEFHLDEMMKEDGSKDYTDRDLRQLDNPERNTRIATEFITHAEWRVDKHGKILNDPKTGQPMRGWGKTLMFAIDVKHAYNLAAKLKELKPELDVRVITGKTKKEDRDEFRKWFSEGDPYTVKVAINCQVYTEGFDEKTINTVFLTRPTKSETLWMQMVGRGARIIRDENDNVVKAMFNLVSVMDEIGKYGTLVKEWVLNVTDEEEHEKKKVAAAHKQRVVAKRRLVELIEEETGILNKIEMDDATLIDVQAILIIASKVSRPSGIPLDRDRFDCVRMLRDYVGKCFVNQNNKMVFDFDAFKDSYSHCVQANEFDHKTWRELMWAYYFRYIRKQSEVWNTHTKRKEKTWRFIPMVPVEEIDSEAAKQATSGRIKQVQENASQKNEEFNLQHGSAEGQKTLLHLVFEEMRNRGMWRELKFVRGYMVGIRCRDRRVEVRTSYTVQGGRDTALKYIGTLNATGTAILQEHLDDSVAEFRVSPARSQ